MGGDAAKARVVELTAECWVWCAKIYLQCRFFRKPFTHPEVRGPLAVLRRCLRLLPFEGALFTSQFPFFAVALASLLARTEADRALPRAWFKGLVAEASCRSVSTVPSYTLPHLTSTWPYFCAHKLPMHNTTYLRSVKVAG